MRRIRTLGIDVVSRGLAFCVLEGSGDLIDYGTTYTKGQHTKDFVDCAQKLFDRFTPDLLVLEDADQVRRYWRRARRLGAINDKAIEIDIAVLPAPKQAIEYTFAATGTTKYEIALEIANRFPELTSKLPKKREIWMSEDGRMHVFDALSFALTVLYELEGT